MNDTQKIAAVVTAGVVVGVAATSAVIALKNKFTAKKEEETDPATVLLQAAAIADEVVKPGRNRK